MNALYLRLLPYLISITGGVAVYIVAEVHIGREEGMYGLITGIASGLLSIPLIFICYEAVNQVCSQRLRRTLFEHLNFEINSIIIDTLRQIKVIIGHTEPLCAKSLNCLFGLTAKDIQSRIVLDATAAQQLRQVKDDILRAISHHTRGRHDVLTDKETENLLGIGKEADTVFREILFLLEQPHEKRELQHLATNIQQLITHISNWIEAAENEALINHQHFRFLNR